MRAIKFIDNAGNISYVEGDTIQVNRSLVKASVDDKPYKGYIISMFFKDFDDLYIFLEQNPNKVLIGKGCLSTGLKNGNIGNNHTYKITKPI